MKCKDNKELDNLYSFGFILVFFILLLTSSSDATFLLLQEKLLISPSSLADDESSQPLMVAGMYRPVLQLFHHISHLFSLHLQFPFITTQECLFFINMEKLILFPRFTQKNGQNGHNLEPPPVLSPLGGDGGGYRQLVTPSVVAMAVMTLTMI